MSTALIIVGVLILGYRVKVKIEKHTEWGAFDKRVPWEEVKPYFKNGYRKIPKSCPNCNLESEKQEWNKFRTSNDSWRNLAGREGFYSKCPNCEIYVEEIIVVMN